MTLTCHFFLPLWRRIIEALWCYSLRPILSHSPPDTTGQVSYMRIELLERPCFTAPLIQHFSPLVTSILTLTAALPQWLTPLTKQEIQKFSQSVSSFFFQDMQRVLLKRGIVINLFALHFWYICLLCKITCKKYFIALSLLYQSKRT